MSSISVDVSLFVCTAKLKRIYETLFLIALKFFIGTASKKKCDCVDDTAALSDIRFVIELVVLSKGNY
jgi:hypothetical protein